MRTYCILGQEIIIIERINPRNTLLRYYLGVMKIVIINIPHKDFGQIKI